MRKSRYEFGMWGEEIVCHTLRKRGWTVYPSPGSRGPADILAVKTKRSWCIQVKTRTTDNSRLLGRKEERCLLKYSTSCSGTPVVAILKRNSSSVLRVATHMRDVDDHSTIRDVAGNFVCVDLDNGFMLFFFDLRKGSSLEP